MTTPTFAKTQNLIAFLAKPTESEGFEQIIDFLNGSSIRYALTTSPTISTSCIKQFWSTAKVKIVNDKVRVQALIDAKRVNIKESFIRRILKLDDAEGTSCLANDEIFTGLANMGYEKIFNKLTFYKAFFSPKYIYDNPSLTKKVFANMKRVGTGFSGVITPLFENMLVPATEEVGQAQDDVSIPTEPSTSKPYKKHTSKKQQPKAPKVPSPEPSPEHQLPSPSNNPIPDVDKDNLKFQELMDLCTRLSNKVLDLKSEVIDIKSSFTDKIAKLKDIVHKLEENRILKEKSFKPAKINTTAPVEDKEESFKQGRMIADMDEDVEDIDEEEPAEVEEMLEVVIAAKLITEVVTTANPTITAAQVPKVSAPRRTMGVVIQDPKGTTTSVIVHTKHYNLIQAFLKKVEEEVTVQDKKIEEEGNKRKGKSLEQEIAKKQRMDKGVEELKRHLQIMANDDDDVEDLETLWKLVKEIFETTEPKNFLDDFLLNILKTMFEKPVIEANVWKDQKGRYRLAKKYPLTHFTLEQMLNNVRLKVEEESEMSLELPSLQDIDEEELVEVEEVSAPRRTRGVVIQDPEETTTSMIVHTEVQSKDKGKGILIEKPKPLKGQAQSDMDEAFARQLEAELNANINWNDVIEQVERSERQSNAVMREDLETLWKLVKERFETTEPKNFSDDFLLNILKIMFEKPIIKAIVWKDQKGRYGLEVKEESEMSIELPRSDVLSEVPYSENTHNDIVNQSVQEMSYSEQTHLVNYPKNEITSDSNIIPYSRIRFVPQKKVSNGQAFWLQTSHHNTDQSASLPVKIKAPREFPKVSSRLESSWATTWHTCIVNVIGLNTVGTRDEVFDQHSYCFNVEDDPKTFDEAMKSQDVAFEKEANNDEMDSIMGNNTWVLADLPPGCKPLGCKWIFKRKLKAPKQWHQKFDEVVFSNGYLLNQADKCVYRKFDESGILSSRLSIKDMEEADVIIGIRITHESNGIAISKSHYIKKVLKRFNHLDCTSVSTPMDISDKLMPNNGHAVSQLKSSRVISCLMLPLWSKPVAPISIHCDSVATLAKAYRQTYNGKFRHLGGRHNIIHVLITNGVVSIEFVRSQQNLVDHLTKGFAKDLVLMSDEGMGLKSNYVAEC
nr:zinc finger, CCHC-type [Tanacetum cinerariifolium]